MLNDCYWLGIMALCLRKSLRFSVSGPSSHQLGEEGWIWSPILWPCFGSEAGKLEQGTSLKLHLIWNITDRTFTCFPASFSPISYKWEDQKEIAGEERQVWFPLATSCRSRGPPLPTFNKDLPSKLTGSLHSPRLPTFTSQVWPAALINFLCFADSFCHAGQFLLIPW